MRIGGVVRILEVWPDPTPVPGPVALEDAPSEARVVTISGEPMPATA